MRQRTVLAGRIGRLRPPRRLVMLLLSMLVLIGPLYPISSQSARAQTPPAAEICVTGPDGKGGFAAVGEPGRVVQGCDLRSAGMAELEGQAIDDLLKMHQLPPSASNEIVARERDTVRAMLFAKLVDMIEKDPAERAASEQAIVDEMTGIVQGRRVAAVQFSIDKYNEWLADPCAFVEPVETDYMRDDVFCSGNPNGTIWSGGPIPPSIENLLVYGQHHIYEDFQNGGPAFGPSSAFATSMGLLAGAVAAGIAGLAGTVIGGSLTINSALIAALHPFLIEAVLASSNPAAITAVGTVGAGSVGSALAIVVIAVVLVIVRIIQVVAQEEIPVKLSTALTNAQAGIDLGQLVQTKEGKTEIFAAFLLETLPDYDNDGPVGTPDRTFILTDASGNVTRSQTLNYQCWNPTECGSNANHTAWLVDGWFASQDPISGAAHMTLGIDYIDWNGEGWTAWRVGPREFLHTRTTGDATPGDPPEPFTSYEIKFKTWDGSLHTARINQLPTDPGVPSVVQNVNNGAFAISWMFSTDGDNDPISYTLQRCDPTAAIPILGGGTTNPSCTTIASGIPANLWEFFTSPEPQGEWTYRVQTTDDYDTTAFSAESGVITIDQTAPQITVANRSPEPNANGWNKSDVTVDWNCVDVLSLIVPVSGAVEGSVSETVATEGANQSASGACEDKAGNSVTNTVTGINIDKTAPTADVGGPYTINEGSSVLLDGGDSDDELSGVAVLQWDLDGSGQNLIANPAPFNGVDGPDSTTVYLLVIDKAGNPSAASTTVTIANVAPTATFTAPASVDEGAPIILAATDPSDPSAADTQAGFTYAFDCGDGDGYGAFGAISSASCPTSDDGSRTIKGKIQDKDGGATEYISTVSINNVAPSVSLGADATINQNDAFTRAGSFSDPGADDIHTATVNYGDGDGVETLNLNADSSFTLSHTYLNHGEYTLEVCVTDDDAATDCDELAVQVVNQPPAVDAGEPYSGDEGSEITLNPTVNDPESDTLTTELSFVIDSADDGTSCTIADPNQFQTTFTCTDDGSFTVTMTADDGLNPATADSATITIANAAPDITDVAATLGRAQVSIAVTATDPGANDVLSYAFDCDNDKSYELAAGASNTATCQINPHQEGVFTFGVQVSDDDGGITTDMVTVTIATELCANDITGVLRYADGCRGHETAITLPDDGPVTVCASRHDGLLRNPANGSCARHEISYLLPEEGPLNVCISSYTQTMRTVDALNLCAGHEFGRVIAATEVGEPPPRSR